VKYRTEKIPEIKCGLMEYCMEQEHENTRFVSNISWKDEIKKSNSENICVILVMVTDYIRFFVA